MSELEPTSNHPYKYPLDGLAITSLLNQKATVLVGQCVVGYRTTVLSRARAHRLLTVLIDTRTRTLAPNVRTSIKEIYT